jgi:hypothetical protein
MARKFYVTDRKGRFLAAFSEVGVGSKGFVGHWSWRRRDARLFKSVANAYHAAGVIAETWRYPCGIVPTMVHIRNGKGGR